MTDLRLTFIDIWWPQILAFWKICKMYQKKAKQLSTLKVTTFFFLTSNDRDLDSNDLFWPFNLKDSSYFNCQKIDMLHIRSNLTIAILQRKYVQASNGWHKVDLHWPLMTSKLSVLEHLMSFWASLSLIINIFFFWSEGQ